MNEKELPILQLVDYYLQMLMLKSLVEKQYVDMDLSDLAALNLAEKNNPKHVPIL